MAEAIFSKYLRINHFDEYNCIYWYICMISLIYVIPPNFRLFSKWGVYQIFLMNPFIVHFRYTVYVAPLVLLVSALIHTLNREIYVAWPFPVFEDYCVMSRELHYGLSLEHGSLSVALSKVLNDSIQGSSIRHMTSRFSKSSELNSNLPETRIVQRYQSRVQNPMGPCPRFTKWSDLNSVLDFLKNLGLTQIKNENRWSKDQDWKENWLCFPTLYSETVPITPNHMVN